MNNLGTERIEAAFRKEKAFIPFFVCGDPKLETTAKLVRVASEGGADLIELGIPFSDPTAEGPIIQEAGLRALEGGVTTDRIFDFVMELRKDVIVPMVFMTYANVIYSYGAEKFISTCNKIGIEGIIVIDLPFEEKEEFQLICRQYGVALISTVAAASDERVSMIAKEAEGFINVIMSPDDVKDENNMLKKLSSITKTVRENTNIPCAVGFEGLSAEQVQKISRSADGVIAASDIVEIVAKYGENSIMYLSDYFKEMKNVLAY